MDEATLETGAASAAVPVRDAIEPGSASAAAAEASPAIEVALAPAMVNPAWAAVGASVEAPSVGRVETIVIPDSPLREVTGEDGTPTRATIVPMVEELLTGPRSSSTTVETRDKVFDRLGVKIPT